MAGKDEEFGQASPMMMIIQAQKTGKVVYHFVKCVSHGKSWCDAEGCWS